VALLVLAVSAHAEVPVLSVSHTFHHYAGGGGCIERFLVERDAGGDAAYEDVHISLRFQIPDQESIAEQLTLDRLGTTAMDNWQEVTVELSQCPIDGAKVTVIGAYAKLNGQTLDLVGKSAVRSIVAPHLELEVQAAPNPSIERLPQAPFGRLRQPLMSNYKGFPIRQAMGDRDLR
jgi:hypothetical protein